MKDFSKLCTPAKIYFAIAVIATLFDLLNGAAFMFAFWKMVFAFVWTFILGGLCDKGYKSISWFLVLLPYILMFLASLNIYHVTDEQRQFMRSIQLQGAFGQEAFSVGNIEQSAQQNMQQQQQQMQSVQQMEQKAKEAALKSLTDREIDKLAIPTHPGELITFDKDIKTANTDSLKKVASKIEWEIILLDKDINSRGIKRSVRESKKYQKGVQQEKLNKVNEQIKTRS